MYQEEEVLGKAYDSRLMRRLLAYLKPYRWYVVLAVAILLLASLAQIAGPFLTKIAIDRYVVTGDLDGLVRICAVFLAVLLVAFKNPHRSHLD